MSCSLRFLLKIALLLTMIFALCIGLIRARPHNDGELRAFLTPPEGCPMPCFMGIRPGVTTAAEAIAILEAHEWVAEVYIYRSLDYGQIDLINWNWNEKKNPLIDQSRMASIHAIDRVVADISIPTTFSLGETWLVWGQPGDTSYVVGLGSEDAPLYLQIFSSYSELPLNITTSMNCPYFPILWHSPVVLTLHNGENPFGVLLVEQDTENSFLNFAIDLKRAACE
jgi:hypothetical protein